MAKRRHPLTDFALPIPGRLAVHPRTRGAEELIRIEHARTNPPVRLISEAQPIAEAAQAEPSAGAPAGASAGAITGAITGTITGAQAVPHLDGLGRKLSKAELAELEDAALLQRFQAGDEAAFYTLFERRHKEIYTHCYRMCGRDAEKANDAFQDTFVKVFSRKDLFSDATNGRAWLYRIATNTCLNQIRYDKRHPGEALNDTLNSTDPRMQPDFETEQDSLRSSLEQAVAKLPVELREPFLLRELEEFSYEDAAAQLGITVAACRQRVYRAKQLLREELQEVVTGETPKKKGWGRKG